MTAWIEVVETLKNRTERFDALARMSDGRIGARANRRRRRPPDRVDALIWGLRHESLVVRRCCLELLDQHPDERAIPHIVECLNDDVPRVRWHAVRALICDANKPGTSYLSDEILDRIREIAPSDTHAKVRAQAQWGIVRAGGCATQPAHAAGLLGRHDFCWHKIRTSPRRPVTRHVRRP